MQDCVTKHLINDGRPRDAHLSLRHETKHVWRVLKESIPGLTETAAAISVALWQEKITGERNVSYSRSPEHYADRNVGIVDPIYTLTKVVHGMDFLAREGLLGSHFVQRPGRRGYQSTATASTELVAIVGDVVRSAVRLVPKRNRAPVVLRDAQGRPMSLPSTRALSRQVARVERVNECMRSADISHGAASTYSRIYHGDLTRGGRWYADGLSWQNLEKSQRHLLRIDGEPVVEIDYVTNHAAMIYSDAGIPLPHDAYEIDGSPRKLTKVVFLTLLNARSRAGAIGSISHSDIVRLVGVEPGTPEATRIAADVVTAVMDAHVLVRRAFHSDAGAGLMRRDAEICEDILIRLLNRSIVALAVHDSFLVKWSKGDDLEEIMTDVAHEHGLPEMRVARV